MGDNVIDRGAVHVSDTRWCFALMRGSLMEFLGSWFIRLSVGRTRSEVKPTWPHCPSTCWNGLFVCIFLFCQILKFLYFSFYFFQFKRHFFFCWPYTIILTSILVQGELMELQANLNFFPLKMYFLVSVCRQCSSSQPLNILQLRSGWGGPDFTSSAQGT